MSALPSYNATSNTSPFFKKPLASATMSLIKVEVNIVSVFAIPFVAFS
jgi:hypothetical protein